MWVKSIILSNFPPTVRIFLAYIGTNPLGHLLGKKRESNHEKYFCVFLNIKIRHAHSIRKRVVLYFYGINDIFLIIDTVLS